jgi:hypothetical protein
MANPMPDPGVLQWLAFAAGVGIGSLFTYLIMRKPKPETYNQGAERVAREGRS